MAERGLGYVRLVWCLLQLALVSIGLCGGQCIEARLTIYRKSLIDRTLASTHTHTHTRTHAHAHTHTHTHTHTVHAVIMGSPPLKESAPHQ